ncbi:MAG: PilZ domain-containing protein [Acidobacteria bacterium]|nr:PilZ domain-containing protein [Acidobacteriota bacterium]
MAALKPERRRRPRVPGEHSAWRTDAILRPGLPVSIIDISNAGARLRSPGRLRPGRPVELQLVRAADESRVSRRAAVHRCAVVGLRPLLFEGAVIFEHWLEDPVEG